mmetsp:Transcript_31007/g.87821  ORF Transcript_31007/g.87821 Transcript_31007/m.87821 type:complete len:243 (+) Transcript_31007:724-1452(+)
MPLASDLWSAAATRIARACVSVGAAVLLSASGLMRKGMSSSRPSEVCWDVILAASMMTLSALTPKAWNRLAMPALKSSSISANAWELMSEVASGRVTKTRTVAVVAQVSEFPAQTPHSSTPFQQQPFCASRTAGPQHFSPARVMGQVSVSPSLSMLTSPGTGRNWPSPKEPSSGAWVETSMMVIVPSPEKAGKAREGLLAKTSMKSWAPVGSSTNVTIVGTAIDAARTPWMVTAGLDVMPRS